MTSEQKLTMWIRQFNRVLRETTEEISQDLGNLNKQREIVIQQMKDMVKFKNLEL